MRSDIIAIITARGGSKRISKKNIKNFCGKPILAYSVEAAIESDLFDEVMVSTDSEEIAEVGRKYGASVPFMRSENASSDYATTSEVILEVLEEYKKRGKSFTYACCIYPTAPFITSDSLKKAVALIKEKKTIQVMPVVKYSYPPLRSYVIKNGYAEYKWPEYANARSQDLEEFYHDCGQFYVYDVKKYQELKGQVLKEIYPLEIPETQVQDIDSLEDWKIAEIKYRIMQEKKN